MDRYERIRKIGEGSFGCAVLCKNKKTGKEIVIKEISLLQMKPKEREDAKKEVALLARLAHPNIGASREKER